MRVSELELSKMYVFCVKIVYPLFTPSSCFPFKLVFRGIPVFPILRHPSDVLVADSGSHRYHRLRKAKQPAT